jgi:hypothetical protein
MRKVVYKIDVTYEDEAPTIYEVLAEFSAPYSNGSTTVDYLMVRVLDSYDRPVMMRAGMFKDYVAPPVVGALYLSGSGQVRVAEVYFDGYVRYAYHMPRDEPNELTRYFVLTAEEFQNRFRFSEYRDNA